MDYVVERGRGGEVGVVVLDDDREDELYETESGGDEDRERGAVDVGAGQAEVVVLPGVRGDDGGNRDEYGGR